MLQHCKTQWSFPEAESSSPWLHAALPSAILQHYCNFTVGDSDSADSPPPKKKNFNQPAKISTPETPQKPKKNTSSSIDGITGCSVTFWSFKGRLEVMGRFFVQSPGRWWVGWVVWFGVQHGFKKKTQKSQGRHPIFLVFSGKDFCFFLGGLFGGTYMDGSPKKPPGFFRWWKCLERVFFRMYPVTLRKIVDYNHISPEKSRR